MFRTVFVVLIFGLLSFGVSSVENRVLIVVGELRLSC